MKRFRVREETGPARTRGRWRKAAFLATALSVLTALTAAPATVANADTTPRTTILRSWTQGQCLDSNYVGNVYELNCNGGNYQNWNIEAFGQAYLLQDAQTGLCLENDSGWPNVFTAPCFATGEQQWLISEFTDGLGHDVMNIEQSLGNGCLDANVLGGLPYVNSNCYSGGYQDWKPGL